MKFLIMTLGIGLVLALTTTALAQEPEKVNEIVVRVNNEIITLVDYQNALRDFREELGRQMTGKSEAEIDAEFVRLKPTVLNYMIDDLLLEQKAKELNIDVEAEVNQRMKDIANQNGQPTVLAFENELKKQGIDPEGARASIRKQFQQQSVIQREVLAPIYQRLNDKDKLDFYKRNQDAFKIPGWKVTRPPRSTSEQNAWSPSSAPARASPKRCRRIRLSVELLARRVASLAPSNKAS